MEWLCSLIKKGDDKNTKCMMKCKPLKYTETCMTYKHWRKHLVLYSTLITNNLPLGYLGFYLLTSFVTSVPLSHFWQIVYSVDTNVNEALQWCGVGTVTRACQRQLSRRSASSASQTSRLPFRSPSPLFIWAWQSCVIFIWAPQKKQWYNWQEFLRIFPINVTDFASNSSICISLE